MPGSWARTIALVSLLTLSVVYLIYAMISAVEVTGRRAFDPGLYLAVFYSVVPALLLVTFVVSYAVDANRAVPGSEHEALFSHPRYVWDVWNWFVGAVAAFLLLLAIVVPYFAKFGFGADPNFDSPAVADGEVDRYIAAQVLASSASYAAHFFALHVVYAYAFNTYPLRSLDEIRLALKQRGDVLQRYRDTPYALPPPRSH